VALACDPGAATAIVVEEPGEQPRFPPLVAGNNRCVMAQGYFPTAALSAMLPDYLTIPDSSAMARFYPDTPLRPDSQPFLLSFCHGAAIRDLITEHVLPEQEELMFVFPVVHTSDQAGMHLCSYIPVLYLDSEPGVAGGRIYGLRKEYHPAMRHGGDGSSTLWWSVEDIIDASFTLEEIHAGDRELPQFFTQTFANPFVTISYPPEPKTVFYEATLSSEAVGRAAGTVTWNFSGTTIRTTEHANAVYSAYSFTMSHPMDEREYFGVADD
jgi:hypothetical protein